MQVFSNRNDINTSCKKLLILVLNLESKPVHTFQHVQSRLSSLTFVLNLCFVFPSPSDYRDQ